MLHPSRQSAGSNVQCRNSVRCWGRRGGSGVFGARYLYCLVSIVSVSHDVPSRTCLHPNEQEAARFRGSERELCNQAAWVHILPSDCMTLGNNSSVPHFPHPESGVIIIMPAS